MKAFFFIEVPIAVIVVMLENEIDAILDDFVNIWYHRFALNAHGTAVDGWVLHPLFHQRDQTDTRL